MVQAMLNPVIDGDKRLDQIAEALEEEVPRVVRSSKSASALAEAGVGTDVDIGNTALD